MNVASSPLLARIEFTNRSAACRAFCTVFNGADFSTVMVSTFSEQKENHGSSWNEIGQAYTRPLLI